MDISIYEYIHLYDLFLVVFELEQTPFEIFKCL